MQIQQNVPLARYTSFGVGGQAEKLITITNSDELDQILTEIDHKRPWLLGHGTNVLISDQGLPGVTLRFSEGKIDQDSNTLIADAGVAWDELVQTAIDNELWGLELTSGVPGSVGAASYINITAYGQSNADRLKWVEVYDLVESKVTKLTSSELKWGYKESIFQTEDRYVLLRSAYDLSPEPTSDLTYQSALDVAQELNLEPNTLEDRRAIILETRRRAGSLFSYSADDAKTVGSFFRNPLVSKEQADRVIEFDETGKTKEQISKMNQVHGGETLRVSAAHCMLAAGFKRGQSWGPVRLHPEHVLKIENYDGASAQQIYDTAQLIIKTVKEKLDIRLQPEAKILGKFN